MPTNIKDVAMSVAMVIPEIGFDEEPINPTMRDETVTKKNPNTTIIIAETKLVGICGITDMKTISSKLLIITYIRGRSFSVLDCSTFPVSFFLRSRNESRKALIIVGKVFINVIIPPKVTAQ